MTVLYESFLTEKYDLDLTFKLTDRLESAERQRSLVAPKQPFQVCKLVYGMMKQEQTLRDKISLAKIQIGKRKTIQV